MTEKGPRVSVVMGVYNDCDRLPVAVESILGQSLRDLELIVVDDGSIDGSAAYLDRMVAADTRLRVLRQQNQGLTRALIRGCAEARGQFIARQDSDDWSHPQRLEEQVALLDNDNRLGFVSCATQYVGPEDEPLYALGRPADPEAATRALLHERQGPPAHGSVMFRRDLYERVGGYRDPFHYSQDSDLWLRLGEQALIAYLPSIRYMHRKDIQSTSGAQRPLQRRFAEIGHACRQARMAGADETRLLAEAAELSDSLRGGAGQRAADPAALDAASYMLGSQLAQNRDARARKYLWAVLRRRPWHVRAWARLVQSFLTGRSS